MAAAADTPMADASAAANTGGGFVTQFEDRQGIYQFQKGTEGYGYLPQVNEWAQKARYHLEWVCTRVGGQAHAPEFSAFPKCALWL